MSTLCDTPVGEQIEQQAADSVWNFKYPLIAPAGFPSARAASQAEREARIQRAEAAAIESARQSGFRQGETQAQAALAQRLEQERRAVAEAIEQFTRERREYFRHVERDVVTLALAIARKLLHREAQVDPLLLSGVVRVALDRIQAGSQVVLRCSTSERESWQGFLATMPESSREVTVTGDGSLEPGRVVIETVAGKAEVSLADQLQEIERGFLDLLRPVERQGS